MTSYKDVFLNPHAILPVIHVESKKQASSNSHLAQQQGCDGVFLVGHGMQHDELLEIHHAVSNQLRGWWIGVNCLDLTPSAVFEVLTDEVSGVWVDNALIDERTENQPEAEEVSRARLKSGWQGLYFGGVAFKYQRPVADLEKAVQLAAKYMDVITTSGPGTGQAADRDKIQTMKDSLGSSPLAIASGITPQNIDSYLDIADCFMVSTGISRSWSELDPELVNSLVTKIRAYRGKL